MDLNKIRIDLDRLDSLIKKITHEQHQYFLGNLKYPPVGTEREIKAIMSTYNKITITNTMLAFKYKNLLAKFLSLNEKWNREQQERDGHKKTYKQFAKKTDAAKPDGMKAKVESELEKLAGKYDVDKIREQVNSRINSLKNKGYTDIDIRVDLDQNGKAKLRIAPVK